VIWIVNLQLVIVSLLTEMVECFYLTVYPKTLQLTTLITPHTFVPTSNLVPLILLSQSTVYCPNHCLSPHSPLTLSLRYLHSSISKSGPILDYTHANWPLFRSTLDQLIVINPCIRERTDLEHMTQEFSSAMHQAAFTAIPRLADRYLLLTPP
jgi:hypothetical protein